MKSVLLLVCGAFPLVAADFETITVSAGEHDRRNCLVSFRAERPLAREAALVGNGKTFPLQVSADGVATFVIDHLGTGQELKLKAGRAGSVARLEPEWDKNKVKVGPSPGRWLEYQSQPSALPRTNIKQIFQRGAYLHPIRTLSGAVLTDDYPPNHVHHHGIWWAWTKTEFEGRAPDFWNMGGGKATVEFVTLERSWGGAVHSGFVSKHRFVDLSAPMPTTALNETWDVRAYNNAADGIWIFDLTSTQECATDKPLKLPEYHYGGLGFRGRWEWNGKTNANFLTSEGITDREQGHGTRARWCDISGLADGKRAGITIMCHPENFRAPQHMRLHPSEPFFCYAPQQGGDMEIAPGKKYVSRYRFVVHDGPARKEVIERHWNDYAHPPAVKVN
jgi:Methane oxygenase PmoA